MGFLDFGILATQQNLKYTGLGEVDVHTNRQSETISKLYIYATQVNA
jgi:hypothetical protein